MNNTECSASSLKNIIHKYSKECDGSTENYWHFSSGPLAPSYYHIPPVEVKVTEQTDLLLHGILAVLVTSLCSTFGMIIVPLFQRRPKVFAYTMLYLMSLAVSALSGAATMVLIPEGLGLMDCDELRKPNLTVCFGILTFFIIRRVLHAWTGHDDIFTHGLEDAKQGTNKSKTTTIAKSEFSGNLLDAEGHPVICNNDDSDSNCGSKTTCKRRDCAMKKKVALANILQMKSVGWMTLLGDAAHNFLDGIAMGASFMQKGKTKGWQITIAILAEEFPHELGDYAVLLKAGLTPCEAVICNVISGLTCLVGFVVGWKVESFAGNEVFSWMGGVFLFISLACMLPEVESTISDMNSEFKKSKIGVTAVAIAGFISGYVIVYSAGAYIHFGE